MADVTADDFERRFLALAEELELGRRKEERPHHLFANSLRTVIQAVRLTLESHDAGILDFVSLQVRALSSLVEHESASDQQCWGFWWTFISPLLRPVAPKSFFKAGAGQYDIPFAVVDADGRPIDKSGKPLRSIVETDPHTGLKSYRLEGESALNTDGHDEVDWMARLRRQAADWADCCRALAYLCRTSKIKPGFGTKRSADECERLAQETIPDTVEPIKPAQAVSSKDWIHHPGEPRPPQFKEGPVAGTREALGYALRPPGKRNVTSRTLLGHFEKRGSRVGSDIYVVEEHSRLVTVWFTSAKAAIDAQTAVAEYDQKNESESAERKRTEADGSEAK